MKSNSANGRRYLSKSRYKEALECPTKLFYTGKKEYGNKKLEDAFLRELAKGGFQVGALARAYYPQGIEVVSKNSDEALAETATLMARDSVVIFEPAFVFENLLVRVDIVVKDGKHIRLIEVKSKSYDPDDVFYDKTKMKKQIFKIRSDWAPYLHDVAFQHHVVSNSLSGFTVTPYLCMADKSTLTSVEGLNQLFLIQSDGNGRCKVAVDKSVSLETLGKRILIEVDVTKEVQAIQTSPVEATGSSDIPEQISFAKYVSLLAQKYEADERLTPQPGSKCKTCEYRISPKHRATGIKSAFEECWVQAFALKVEALTKPLVIDIWNHRSSDKLLEARGPLMETLDREDLNIKPLEDEPGLSSSQRQWLQVEKVKEKDATPYVELEELSKVIKGWAFPYHFIDFETSMVALPFNKDRRPYEQIAFQFSHHVMHADGRIEHRGEFINQKRGEFPNFDFVRALKKDLTGDEGTIFRFAAHENTVLCQIYLQLKASNLPDREELCAWVRTVTKSTAGSEEKWEGARNMVDMCEIVKRFYYHPATHGSNSIKKVLPAILQESKYLQEKYSKAIYGVSGKISSKNFQSHTWIEMDANGEVKDPYKQLQPIFAGVENDVLDRFMESDELADGGAAMMAYAKMQFSQMTDEERALITSALLRYCELDTLAMVMICEYWRELVSAVAKTVAA